MDKFNIPIPNELKETLSQKIKNFKKFIYEIVPENKKDLLNDEFKDIENNYMKILMFVIFLTEKNMEKNINEFIQKFEIAESHKNKISQYYN